jgi:hypothetical protein
MFESLSDHSMNIREPNMRFHLIDGFLDSISCRLGRVHGHAFRASFVDPRLCPCDASIGSSHVVPLIDSRHFSNDHTRFFLELIFHGMFLRGTQRLHF